MTHSSAKQTDTQCPDYQRSPIFMNSNKKQDRSLEDGGGGCAGKHKEQVGPGSENFPNQDKHKMAPHLVRTHNAAPPLVGPPKSKHTLAVLASNIQLVKL